MAGQQQGQRTSQSAQSNLQIAFIISSCLCLSSSLLSSLFVLSCCLPVPFGNSRFCDSSRICPLVYVSLVVCSMFSLAQMWPVASGICWQLLLVARWAIPRLARRRSAASLPWLVLTAASAWSACSGQCSALSTATTAPSLPPGPPPSPPLVIITIIICLDVAPNLASHC